MTTPETVVEPKVTELVEATETNATPMSFTLLLVGIGIMLIGSTFPIIFTNAAGKADHGIAMALFWAMSAAIIRGVGYLPNITVFKWLFSGWAVVVGLGIAFLLRFVVG